MAAFTNTRLVPLDKDGNPVRVQEYKSKSTEPSRGLAELEKLFLEEEKKQAKK